QRQPDIAPAPIEELHVASGSGGAATTANAMPVRPPEAMPQPPGSADGSRVMLRFTGDTRVQVKERGGETLLTRGMRAGENWQGANRGNLVLNTGNDGRVDILVDGAEVPSIGGPGSVRKDVPLDPGQLKTAAASGHW